MIRPFGGGEFGGNWSPLRPGVLFTEKFHSQEEIARRSDRKQASQAIARSGRKQASQLSDRKQATQQAEDGKGSWKEAPALRGSCHSSATALSVVHSSLPSPPQLPHPTHPRRHNFTETLIIVTSDCKRYFLFENTVRRVHQIPSAGRLEGSR